MLLEAPAGGEVPAAGRAAERFASRVDQLVRLQVPALAELLPADATLKWLFPAVDAFVSDEVLRHAKASPADLADVRLLAAVRALMQRHAGVRGKAFAALSAAKGLPL